MAFHTNNYGNSGQRKEAKIIQNRMFMYFDLLQKYMNEGMAEQEASKKAKNEVCQKLKFK